MREILKEELEKRDWTPYEFEKHSGVPQPTTYRFLKGPHGDPKTETVKKWARALGLTEQQLRGLEPIGKTAEKKQESDGSKQPTAQVIAWETPDDLPSGVYAIVPRVRLFLSAGNGRYATEEELGAPLAFTAQWIHERGLHKKNLVCVNAIGDSMEPRIHCGDTLLVNVGDKAVTDGNVYAIRYGDDLRVKRLFKRFDGGFIIRSDNSAKYPDEIAAPLDIEAGHICVIGRVVWVSGNI